MITPGEEVKRLLKKRGIKSPSIKNRVKIEDGLWIVSDKSVEELKKKYGNKFIKIVSDEE